MTIRILLVDDHRILREGLRALLVKEPDLEVVGEASDGRAAIEQVRALSPDVVVMDVGMAGLNGIEATREIRARCRSTQVVALSVHADSRFVTRMLDAGAAGYVVKASAHEELLNAVRAVSRGQRYTSTGLAAPPAPEVASEPHGTSAPRHRALAAREREILQLVAEGRTSADIAERLRISVRTVETHRRNIARKLGLHSTAELTKYALREGLTSLEE